MTIAPIAPVGPLAGILQALPATGLPQVQQAAPTSFAAMLKSGIADVDSKMQAADAAVRSFVLDDSVPVHQVSYALENARMSLELMLQVRNRLVEGYQQLMTMQM